MVVPVKIYDVARPISKNGESVWKIGLGISVALVGGGIVWWYYKRSSSKSKVITTDSNTQANGVVVSENGIKEPEVQTPLERAEQIKRAGNDFFKKGEYLDALRCYSEAIDLCPASETTIQATYYQNRAACYERLNKIEEVVKDCSKALELNPKYVKACSRRAKAYQTLGQLTGCLEDVTAMCILENFQNQRTLEMADLILKEVGKLNARKAMENKAPVQPSPHFVKNYFATFPNDPVISASDFQVVEINHSESADSTKNLLERAKQLLVRGRYDEVIQTCTEAVTAGEGLEPEALLLRATMYLLRGQNNLALDDLNTIIGQELTPTEHNTNITVNALIKRASLYLQSNEKEKTFEDLATAERLAPNIPDLYLHRGQVNLLTDNVEQSIADYNTCVSLDPDFAIGMMQGYYAQYRRAVQQNSSSGIAKVIEKFKRGIRKFPACSEAYALLAQVLMDQQQFDEADNYYDSAMRMDPANATIRVHRALLQLQWKGDVDAAIKYINEGIQVDNKCSFCYETLATIEVQRGNLRQAVELFNKALPLAKTEQELAHIFSLRDSAVAQLVVVDRLGMAGLIGL
ncbi:mitochondrial import receptor subunit TOM70-like [Macrosteles quadrilineatus]|uniref:mitochondrial import receptor subunit TOM70-like n=1 Tax=Macrosteles quadrilineatus TaxID=74068 RepID=UPI0023E2340D|nr:mitochondrial import receptor subunit TOM70-like [Macrosteles quadrilineatus]